MTVCCNVFNVWPKTTLLPVWCRDAKKLDTPGRTMQGLWIVDSYVDSQPWTENAVFNLQVVESTNPHKWIHIVQTCVVQGSTVLINFF